MAHRVFDISQARTAKVAGFMFLFSLIVPSLNWAFVLSKLIVAGDVVATANNIIANETLFRIGLTIELIMTVGAVVLALVLCKILAPVDRDLAWLAVFWKLIEATLGAVIVLVSFVALQVLDSGAYLTVFTPDQLMTPVGFMLNIHTVLFAIPMVFLGLNMVLFNYLFYKSKFVPAALAGFGILSYFLILIHGLANIVNPDFASRTVIQAVFYTPSIIFEMIIGLWLLIKGLNIQQVSVPKEKF